MQIKQLEEQNQELRAEHETTVQLNIETVQIAADARTSAEDARSFVTARLDCIDE